MQLQVTKDVSVYKKAKSETNMSEAKQTQQKTVVQLLVNFGWRIS